jgi:hypothetical protein
MNYVTATTMVTSLLQLGLLCASSNNNEQPNQAYWVRHDIRPDELACLKKSREEAKQQRHELEQKKACEQLNLKEQEAQKGWLASFWSSDAHKPVTRPHNDASDQQLERVNNQINRLNNEIELLTNYINTYRIADGHYFGQELRLQVPRQIVCREITAGLVLKKFFEEFDELASIAAGKNTLLVTEYARQVKNKGLRAGERVEAKGSSKFNVEQEDTYYKNFYANLKKQQDQTPAENGAAKVVYYFDPAISAAQAHQRMQAWLVQNIQVGENEQIPFFLKLLPELQQENIQEICNLLNSPEANYYKAAHFSLEQALPKAYEFRKCDKGELQETLGAADMVVSFDESVWMNQSGTVQAAHSGADWTARIIARQALIAAGAMKRLANKEITSKEKNAAEKQALYCKGLIEVYEKTANLMQKQWQHAYNMLCIAEYNESQELAPLDMNISMQDLNQ